jgi:metal-sulfur cluster biosynthetic enzyme
MIGKDILLGKNEEEQKIWEAIGSVSDPELGASIVDLGLIYAVNVDNNKVNVKMTFTTPLCPFGDSLVQNIKECLNKLNYESDVDVTFNPPWSLDKIHESIREHFTFPSDI